MHILITGGAGFIGTSLCKHILNNDAYVITNIDKLTYAADIDALKELKQNDRYNFHQINICDFTKLKDVFFQAKPDAVMHLAAESHVDRSIEGPGAFIQTNLIGTYNMLEVARAYYEDKKPKAFKFHHISTDEVFGTLGDEGAFTEETSYDPRSPYSASKAGSDHLVRAWHETYGLPVILTNCSNNYGPHQYPEKLIPVVIRQALMQQPIPVYGEGQNIRDWLYVEDHAEALMLVLDKGAVGESYNIGGDTELRNIDLVKTICGILDQKRPLEEGKSYSDFITFVEDRAGHDYRYAMDITKIKRDLGWSPRTEFSEGLSKTVDWYLDHKEFLFHEDSDNPSLKRRAT